MTRFVTCLLIPYILVGCITVDNNDVDRGGFTNLKIGLIKIEHENTGPVSYRDVKVFGVWIGRKGLGFGYNNTNKILVDPNQCQVLIVVKTKAQVQYVEEILGYFKEENICIEKSH